MNTLAAKQREHVAALDDITELEQVEQILAIVTGEDGASPTTWFWLRMNEQERNEKFSELSDWAETVLRTLSPRLRCGPDQTVLAEPSRGQVGTGHGCTTSGRPPT